MKKAIALVSILAVASGLLSLSPGWADEPLLLRYKFSAGSTTIYELTGNGVIPMTITLPPETGMKAMPLDTTMDLHLLLQQVCQSVDDHGAGHVDLSYLLMMIKTSMQVEDKPVDSVVTWENKELTITLNGQGLPQDENARKLTKLLASTLKLIISPLGQTKPDPETAKMMAELFSMSGMGGADFSKLSGLTGGLPDKPVKSGDTWKLEDTIEMGGAQFKGSSESKLVAVEDYAGLKCAHIEGEARLAATGKMAGGAPPGLPAQTNITSMDLAVKFTNYFDLRSGQMAATTMNLTENISMVISTGGGQGHQAVQLPATIDNAQMHMEMKRK